MNFRIGGAVSDYPYLPGLPQTESALRPEIVHAESHLFLTTLQGVLKADELRIPSVVTVHGVTAVRGPAVNFAQNVYLRTVGTVVFNKATRVICLTRSDAAEIMKLGCPTKKLRIVPNAVDTELFRPSTDEDENSVVWVGRFVPEKGLNFLIKAARIMTRTTRTTKARFVFVGYGPLKGELQALVSSLGLANTIKFVGPLERDQIADVLARASVFVLPSLKEGMPLSLLEAMSSGRPVVTSRVGGMSEIITHGETGLLVTPGDSEALARAIETILGDADLRKKLGRNARNLVMAKYNWKSVLRALDTVYREACEERLAMRPTS